MSLTDDLIRAAVRAGQLTDPKAERFLADVLIERRNRIGRAFLTRVTPVVDVALGPDGRLTFRNAAVLHQFAAAPPAYRAVWHEFDNTSGEVTRVGETSAAGESIEAPRGLPGDRGTFVRVDISAASQEHPSWSAPVHAYFRRGDGGWTLVGFDRMPGAPPMKPGLVGAEPIDEDRR
jgi:hypothetical protein